MLEHWRQIERSRPSSSGACLLLVDLSPPPPPPPPGYALLQLKSTKVDSTLFSTWGGVARQLLKLFSHLSFQTQRSDCNGRDFRNNKEK